jgi:hypothetical protein
MINIKKLHLINSALDNRIFKKLLFILLVFFSLSSNGQVKKTGIWFSTWYANQGNYFWASEDLLWSKSSVGKNCINQFVADVNADGKSDVVTFNNIDGSWKVATSNGKYFDPEKNWITGHGAGATLSFLSDVTGDNKADAIICYNSGGILTVYVSSATGTIFNNYSLWKTQTGDFSKILFADVDGDAKSDLIGFTKATGTWYVMKSSGTTFNTVETWISGHGSGSDNQYLSDVNGDGKCDAIINFKSSGSFYISSSTGSSFINYNQWGNNIATNENNIIFKDINNDKRADLVYYKNGTFHYHTALASSFTTSSVEWKRAHGDNNSIPFIADIEGINTVTAIVFDKPTGTWKCLPSNHLQPNTYNTWQGWNLRYSPVINGVDKQYDSGDISVIDYQIAEIVEAKIDYIIFDLTNNIHVDNAYIFNRSVEVCKRIQLWNTNNPDNKLRYAIAIGGVNFSGNPQSIEDECKIVFNEFVNQPFGGDNYFRYNGKPAIINYTYQDMRVIFANWTGSKEYWNKFSPLEAEGALSKDYVGWFTDPLGSVPSNNIMFVDPGHNNHSTHFQTRNNGDYYQANFNKVFTNNPSMMVIGSYNEYAEENAVAPANTDFVSGTTEKWPTPSFYWDQTKTNNLKYKSLSLSVNDYNHTLQNSISLFPNPTKDIAIIKGLTIGDKIVINDLLGKTILNTTAKQQDEVISTAGFTAGLYIVWVGGKTRLKLIKE